MQVYEYCLTLLAFFSKSQIWSGLFAFGFFGPKILGFTLTGVWHLRPSLVKFKKMYIGGRRDELPPPLVMFKLVYVLIRVTLKNESSKTFHNQPHIVEIIDEKLIKFFHSKVSNFCSWSRIWSILFIIP